MIPIYLYNEKTKKELRFVSISEAASFLGVQYQLLYHAFKFGNEVKGYMPSAEKKTEDKVMMEYDVPRQELDVPHYATINGKMFVAVKCTDKTNCTACDIYKMQPPRSLGQSPLCYDYSSGKRRIVSICESYKCIWKRKKK